MCIDSVSIMEESDIGNQYYSIESRSSKQNRAGMKIFLNNFHFKWMLTNDNQTEKPIYIPWEMNYDYIRLNTNTIPTHAQHT